MLVLVLILVVIALVLLLAGWFLHVVALAWTSVGISLLAGLALLYDWWQTRSAVRAGDRSESGGAAIGAPPERAMAGSGPDMEPATQVLPVVRPETGGAGGSVRPAGAAGTSPDAANASEPTIQMPVVRPSGSAQGPPGVSRPGGSSSLSVAESGSAGSGAPVGGRPDDAEDGAVPRQGSAVPAGDPTTSGPVAGGEGAPDTTGADAGGSAPGDPGGSRHDDVTVATAAGAATAGAAAAGAAAGSDRSPGDDPGFGAGSGERAQGPAGDGRPGEATTATSTATSATGADAGGGPAAATTAVPAAAQGTDQSRPADTAGPPAGAGVTAAVAGAGTDGSPDPSGGGGDAPPTGGAPAQGGAADTTQAPVDGEAPEEPRDPTAANVVARLPDEVLVIDEHPRYHVQTCRALSGRAVIPLPVSEAVELGFTPCGWCSPNRTLAERHPAQVR